MALQRGHILPHADFLSLKLSIEFWFFNFYRDSYTRMCIYIGKILFMYKTMNFILFLKLYLYIDYFVYQKLR